MEYQRIIYFLEAARTGNFSRAAKQLYISPQALNKQIRLLESELGTQLFTRSVKGAQLTETGRYARDKLERVDRELNHALEDIRQHIKQQKKKLRIGFFSHLPKDALVTPAISLILATYPEFKIELDMVDLFEARELMLAGKLDILFTNTHSQEEWPGEHKVVFGRFPAKVVVSLMHPWALQDQITTEDMSRAVFLKMNRSHKDYNVPERDSFYENIPCKQIQIANNFAATCALLEQGEAFAVFPMAFSRAEESHFKFFDYPGKAVMYETVALCKRDYETPEVLEIMQLIRDEFSLKSDDMESQ